MKALLILSLLLAGSVRAASLKCVGEDKKHEVRMEVDFSEKKISEMTYFKSGKVLKEFSDLKLERVKDIFRPRRVTYDVVFEEGAYYMELDIETDGTITGNYIPKSSLFSFERSFVCE